VLLHRYTGQEDIVVGTPATGRNHPSLEDQLGLYINTLALRLRVSQKDTLRTLLQRVKQLTMQAYKHQLYPFDHLVASLGLAHDRSRYPLFDVWFVLHEAQPQADELLASNYLSVQELPVAAPVSRYDLKFTVQDDRDRLTVTLDYSRALFAPGTAAGIAAGFEQLLRGLPGGSGAKIGQVRMGPPAGQPKDNHSKKLVRRTRL
jgi:non-ribosomal peptide synthetase component F